MTPTGAIPIRRSGRPSPVPGFDRNVFVNCPFDELYLPILRPILFCVLYLGLKPRIALERLNSAEARVAKIVELIRESRFGIHDISRLQAQRKGEFYRLNMPFELGLDVGCAFFGGNGWQTKKCLILEAERYRYQAAISDLSNSDIAVHGNDPQRAMTEVRNWLTVDANLPNAPGPSALWNRFTDFTADHFTALSKRGYSPADVASQPVSELLPTMEAWSSRQAPGPGPVARKSGRAGRTGSGQPR